MGDEKRKLRSSSSEESEAKRTKQSKLSDKKQTSKVKPESQKPRKNGQKIIPTVDTSKCFGEQDDSGTFFKKRRISVTNHIHFLNQFQRGFGKFSVLEQIAEQVYAREIRWFRILMQAETPDLRVTAMQWHPCIPNLLVSGGKAGTVQLHEFKGQSSSEPKSYVGVGPGGTMEAMQFNTKRSGVEVWTASVDGTVSTYNFDTEQRIPRVISPTPMRVWFCSVDVHSDGKTVYAGDSEGKLAIYHLDSGETSYELKLHKGKIKHLEFHPRNPNVMVSASLDKTVKLWDIRMLNEKPGHFECFEHICGVTSATFSRTDGCRLLTTDNQDKIRVYRAPCWVLEHEITHPHRHFQYLTHIRASWHPAADLFVIGRFPNRKYPHYDSTLRSLDVYSALTGQLRYGLMDSCTLITSLALFNSTGSMLATSTGRKVNIWKYNKNPT